MRSCSFLTLYNLGHFSNPNTQKMLLLNVVPEPSITLQKNELQPNC